jgi:hypothetical protein
VRSWRVGVASLLWAVVLSGNNIVLTSFHVFRNTSIEGAFDEAWDKSKEQIRKNRNCGVFDM